MVPPDRAVDDSFRNVNLRCFLLEEVEVPSFEAPVDPVDVLPRGAELAVDAESEDCAVEVAGLALATPGDVPIIMPIPKAAASAPTRPTGPPSFVALRATRREDRAAEAFGLAEANSGLAGRSLAAMGRLLDVARMLIDRSVRSVF